MGPTEVLIKNPCPSCLQDILTVAHLAVPDKKREANNGPSQVVVSGHRRAVGQLDTNLDFCMRRCATES